MSRQFLSSGLIMLLQSLRQSLAPRFPTCPSDPRRDVQDFFAEQQRKSNEGRDPIVEAQRAQREGWPMLANVGRWYMPRWHDATVVP